MCLLPESRLFPQCKQFALVCTCFAEDESVLCACAAYVLVLHFGLRDQLEPKRTRGWDLYPILLVFRRLPD